MGDKLNNSNEPDVAVMPPWLDSSTATLTEDIIRTLATRRADVLAIVLGQRAIAYTPLQFKADPLLICTDLDWMQHFG